MDKVSKMLVLVEGAKTDFRLMEHLFYSKFAISREECNIVIQQNIDKAWNICEIVKLHGKVQNSLPELAEVLSKQLLKLDVEKAISVLCTCVFYIMEYNPKFITE